MQTDNVTIIHDTDYTTIVETVQAIAGSAPCHATNGIYGRQNLPIRQTLLGGFRFMMDREIVNAANPPVLLVAVNSDRSIADYNMMQNAPSYEDRVTYLADALSLLDPSVEVIFFPYDDETPEAVYMALFEGEINLASIHKHANYGRGEGFPEIPGAHFFETSACFPLLNDQKALYEGQTLAATDGAQIVADLYSDDNDMETAYLSRDAKQPRLLFPISVELSVLLGQNVSPAPSHPLPPTPA